MLKKIKKNINSQKYSFNPSNSLYDMNSPFCIWKNQNLTSSQKLVLLCIFSHHRNIANKWFNISVSQIARETSFGTRTVFKILKELYDNNYLFKRRCFSNKTSLQEENEYCIANKVFDEYFDFLIPKSVELHNSHVACFLSGFKADHN